MSHFKHCTYTIPSSLKCCKCVRSICAVLWLGRQPFHGSNSEELIYRVCHGEADIELIRSPATAADEANTKVTAQVVTQLLQKSPKSRFGGAVTD